MGVRGGHETAPWHGIAPAWYPPDVAERAAADKPARGEASFGGLLRELRAAAGLTQEELAARARLSPNAIGALERGVRKRLPAHRQGSRRRPGSGRARPGLAARSRARTRRGGPLSRRRRREACPGDPPCLRAAPPHHPTPRAQVRARPDRGPHTATRHPAAHAHGDRWRRQDPPRRGGRAGLRALPRGSGRRP